MQQSEALPTSQSAMGAQLSQSCHSVLCCLILRPTSPGILAGQGKACALLAQHACVQCQKPRLHELEPCGGPRSADIDQCLWRPSFPQSHGRAKLRMPMLACWRSTQVSFSLLMLNTCSHLPQLGPSWQRKHANAFEGHLNDWRYVS